MTDVGVRTAEVEIVRHFTGWPGGLQSAPR